jgi:hypothetical protein
MAQPSKVGPVVLTLFALPFLGGGLFFLYALLVSQQNFKNGNVTVGVAIALLFVFVGGGIIFASFKGYGLLKQTAALEAANPLSPWLWRTDWAARRAESLSQKSYIGAWILARHHRQRQGSKHEQHHSLASRQKRSFWSCRSRPTRPRHPSGF